MTTRPWMKFFTSDWRGAADLAGCSYAAKGLWIDALCLMHQSPKRGYLLSTNGTAIDTASLARLTCGEVGQVGLLLAELEGAGIFGRDSGAIVCRRMVREENARLKSKANGKMGGNPLLLGVNPSVNPHTHSLGYPSSSVWNIASGSIRESEKAIDVPVSEIAKAADVIQMDPRLAVLMDVGISFGVAQKIIRDHNTPIELLTEYVEMASGDRVTNRAAYVRAAISGGYAPRQNVSKAKQILEDEEMQQAIANGIRRAQESRK